LNWLNKLWDTNTPSAIVLTRLFYSFMVTLNDKKKIQSLESVKNKCQADVGDE
jgi:hypothetical protein